MIVFRIEVKDINKATEYLQKLCFAVTKCDTARKTIFARIRNNIEVPIAEVRSLVLKTPELVNYTWMS